MPVWTAPRDWTTGEVVTESMLDTHVRDNMLMLENKYQTTLPGSPFNGQWTILVDSTTAPTYAWQLRYNSTLALWEYMGGRPGYAEVLTSEGTTSTSYAALATAGPSFTVPVAGTYLVTFGSQVSANTVATVRMSFDVGGVGAADADSAVLTTDTNYSGNLAMNRQKASLAAATALVAKYKTSGGTATFATRYLSVIPFTVS